MWMTPRFEGHIILIIFAVHSCCGYEIWSCEYADLLQHNLHGNRAETKSRNWNERAKVINTGISSLLERDALSSEGAALELLQTASFLTGKPHVEDRRNDKKVRESSSSKEKSRLHDKEQTTLAYKRLVTGKWCDKQFDAVKVEDGPAGKGYTLESCEAACTGTSTCKSFAFDGMVGWCTIYSKCGSPTSNPNNKVENTQGWVIYEKVYVPKTAEPGHASDSAHVPRSKAEHKKSSTAKLAKKARSKVKSIESKHEVEQEKRTKSDTKARAGQKKVKSEAEHHKSNIGKLAKKARSKVKSLKPKIKVEKEKRDKSDGKARAGRKMAESEAGHRKSNIAKLAKKARSEAKRILSKLNVETDKSAKAYEKARPGHKVVKSEAEHHKSSRGTWRKKAQSGGKTIETVDKVKKGKRGVEVVYGIFTSPDPKYVAQLRAVLDTWGSDVAPGNLLVVGVNGSKSKSKSAEFYPAPRCKNGYVYNDGISCKEATLLTRAYSRGADWVVVVGSDNYVFTDHFEERLRHEDPEVPQLLGFFGEAEGTTTCGEGLFCEDKKGGFCGGAGYAISRAALDRMIGEKPQAQSNFITESMDTAATVCDYWSDMATSCIARRRNVAQVDLAGLTGWRLCPDGEDPRYASSCPFHADLYEEAIQTQNPFKQLTFHYIQPKEMYAIHKMKRELALGQSKEASSTKDEAVTAIAREDFQVAAAVRLSRQRADYTSWMNDMMAHGNHSID